jgi:hypothetical protein
VAVVAVAENPRTGERAPKYLNKKVPDSITFLALERKPGLSSTVLELAQVKAAIGRGYLRIVEQTADKAVAPAAAAAVPASPAHSPAPTASAQSPAPAASSSPAPSPTPAAKPPGKEP